MRVAWQDFTFDQIRDVLPRYLLFCDDKLIFFLIISKVKSLIFSVMFSLFSRNFIIGNRDYFLFVLCKFTCKFSLWKACTRYCCIFPLPAFVGGIGLAYTFHVFIFLTSSPRMFLHLLGLFLQFCVHWKHLINLYLYFVASDSQYGFWFGIFQEFRPRKNICTKFSDKACCRL